MNSKIQDSSGFNAPRPTSDSVPAFTIPVVMKYGKKKLQVCKKEPPTGMKFCISSRKEEKELPVDALLDSGATSCFIDREFVDRHKMPCVPKKSCEFVNVADGRSVESGVITHETEPISVQMNGHCSTVVFNIIQVAYPVILGLSWLAKHNPHVDWKTRQLKWNTHPPSTVETPKTMHINNLGF
jgi:hypothetical protein